MGKCRCWVEHGAMNVLLPLPYFLWLLGGINLTLGTAGAGALLTLTAVAPYRHLVREAEEGAERLQT